MFRRKKPESTFQAKRRWRGEITWSPGTQVYPIRDIIDWTDVHRGLKIPLPGDKALYLGLSFRAWCHRGPRVWNLVATKRFVEDYEEIGGSEEHLRDMGVSIEGELEVVPPNEPA